MENSDSYCASASENRSIIDVLKSDFELTRGHHSQLNELQEEIKELTAQRKILSKRKEFNDKCCIHCCSPFNLLFRRKLQCYDCHFWVCRSCVSWDNENKIWLCDVCEKQRLLDCESWSWFYSHLRSRFTHFGRAKILEGACRKRKAESENDSGYGPCSDFRPVLSISSRKAKHSIPNSMADCASLEDCEEDDDDIEDEEEETEIHHSIETIVEGLLGSTLDDASVDRVYPNYSEYEKLFASFHGQLVTAVKNLSLSLKRALHNVPHDNDITPTAAHAALKRLISALVRESEELPCMQSSESVDSSADGIDLLDVEIFSSYESLVASAIINKVVEDNQAKYFKNSDNVNLIIHPKTEKRYFVEQSVSSDNADVTNSFTEAELPLECVQIEEIEEITREYTDSEDDQLSSISHHSIGLQSFDELPVSNVGLTTQLPNLDENVYWKTPFPEFGQDIVDDSANKDDCIAYYPAAITSWEENWLFKRKKKLPLYSNLKYQLMTYCDDPPCMLIPYPSESHCSLESDESSELSESHSVGSLEFSSDSDNQNQIPVHAHEKIQKTSEQNIMKSTPALNFLKPKLLRDKMLSEDKEIQKSSDMFHFPNKTAVKVCNIETKKISTSSGHIESAISNQIIPEKFHHPENAWEKKIPVAMLNNSSNVGENNTENSIPPSSMNGDYSEKLCEKENIMIESEGITTDIFHIPTQPGTIAEREHKKWLNAVPLKNNPYSAENISRRYSCPQTKSLLNHISSFEEFEKKLKDFSQSMSDESVQTELNCGLKSIDTSLYKRDYYINNLGETKKKSMHEFKSLPFFQTVNSGSCESIPEEALNSLEEKVYISAGKVFTLENHVKRLERELKDVSSPSCDLPSFNYCVQKVVKDECLNIAHDPYSSENDDNLIMPSVKTLATKFSFSDCHSENMVNEDPVIPSESTKLKKSRPCMKVHSLTARSLSREFRDRAKQNIPKPMNRIVTVPVQVSDDGASEHESVSSAVSASSPICPAQNETTHGYTSDESSTSTSSLPRLKTRKNISRSILQRASYWERRVEQGLFSDASVNEEFPGIIRSNET